MVPEKQEWQDTHKTSEEKKLELSLGPPGEFLGYKNSVSNTTYGFKRVLEEDKIGAKTGEVAWFSDNNINKKHCKKFSPPWLSCTSSFDRVGKDKQPHSTATPAGTNGSHKRAAFAPVVGWPPIRSFRKNISNNITSKLASKFEGKTQAVGSRVKSESFRNDLYVKIDVEGVPIGRKINLNAYDSYGKLSVAIDELFRGLTAAQKETPASLTQESNTDDAKANAGSVSGSGEYTLVYEDNEGDRMLVGDVPWQDKASVSPFTTSCFQEYSVSCCRMFVSTVKRLRVLKSFEASNPRLPSNSRSELENTPLASVVETGR